MPKRFVYLIATVTFGFTYILKCHVLTPVRFQAKVRAVRCPLSATVVADAGVLTISITQGFEYKCKNIICRCMAARRLD